MQWDEGGGRILVGDNRRRGGHAATGQVPVCWCLDFIRTLLFMHTIDYMCTQFRLNAGLYGLLLLRKSGSASTNKLLQDATLILQHVCLSRW